MKAILLIISLILNFGAAVGQSCYTLIGTIGNSYHCNYGSRALGFQTGYSTGHDVSTAEKCYQKCINRAVGNLANIPTINSEPQHPYDATLTQLKAFDWDGDGTKDIANSFHWKSGRCYCNLNDCGSDFQSGSTSYNAYKIDNDCVAAENSALKFKDMEKVFDYPNPITKDHWYYPYLPTDFTHASKIGLSTEMCQGLSSCKGLKTSVTTTTSSIFITSFTFDSPSYFGSGTNLVEDREVWIKSTCESDDRVFEWDRSYTVPPTTLPTNPANIFECVCQPGKYDASNTCTPCAQNTYKDEAGNEACDACPSGYFQDQTGQIECKSCDGSSTSYCTTNCAQGTYDTGSGCQDCPAGWYQDGTGQTVCKECNAGSAPNNERTTCDNCLAGTYESAASCIDCPAGFYQDQVGQVTCKACSGSSAGATTCDQCAAGRYVSVISTPYIADSSTNYECASGDQTVSETQCEEYHNTGSYYNYYTDFTDSLPYGCVDYTHVYAGTTYHLLAFNRKDVSAYNQVDENKKAVCSSEEETCTDCDAGLYQDEAGQQECKECTGTLVNATTCEACTAGRFVSVTLPTYIADASTSYVCATGDTGITQEQCEDQQSVRIAPLDSRMLTTHMQILNMEYFGPATEPCALALVGQHPSVRTVLPVNTKTNTDNYRAKHVQRVHTAMTVRHANSALQVNTRINPANHRANSALQVNTRINPANHHATVQRGDSCL